jgi:hypothetical protein
MQVLGKNNSFITVGIKIVTSKEFLDIFMEDDRLAEL